MATGDGEAPRVFQEADGTSIEFLREQAALLLATLLAASYTGSQPRLCANHGLVAPANHRVEALYLGPEHRDKPQSIQAGLVWLADAEAKPVEPRALPGGKHFVICGLAAELDATGTLILVQLAIGSRALVLHSSSGAFESPALRKALNEAVIESSNGPLALLFTGSELTKTALSLWADMDGIALQSFFDCSSLLSQELEGHPSTTGTSTFDGPRDVSTALRHYLTSSSAGAATAATAPKLGLEQMLNAVLPNLPSPWKVSQQVAKSDWSALPLTLPQIKHCALQAWASKAVGEYAVLGPVKAGCRRLYKLKLQPEALLGLPVPSDVETSMGDLSLGEGGSSEMAIIKPFSLRLLANHPSKPLAAMVKLLKARRSREAAAAAQQPAAAATADPAPAAGSTAVSTAASAGPRAAAPSPRAASPQAAEAAGRVSVGLGLQAAEAAGSQSAPEVVPPPGPLVPPAAPGSLPTIPTLALLRALERSSACYRYSRSSHTL
jgi:hypothetical protein